RAHVVHLAMAGAGITPGAIDLFHDHRGLGQPQAGASVLLRNHRGEPAGLRQRIDECFRVAALLVHLAVVLVGKAGAQRAHAFAHVLVFFGRWTRHGGILVQASSALASIVSQPSWSRVHRATLFPSTRPQTVKRWMSNSGREARKLKLRTTACGKLRRNRSASNVAIS